MAKKIRSAFGAAKEKYLNTLIFAIYCSFKKQFFEKIRNFFQTLYTTILLFIAFLGNNFPEKLLKCSKTVPLAPKIPPPPNRQSVEWGRLSIIQQILGRQPPNAPIKFVPGSRPLLNFSRNFFSTYCFPSLTNINTCNLRS